MTKKLALLGGKPAGAPKQLPHPTFDPAAIREVVALLRKGATVGLGRTDPVITRAEAAISRYHDGRCALTVNSGHSALMCALMGLEIGPGDEVITTPYTWGASISCILDVGAIPVFVDVDPVTGLIDPARIERAITRRTKAVLAVHLYGVPADMPAINRVAKRHKLFVIEDGSQAHGATIGGEVVGNFSDAAGFSCMGGKLLATAEAGYMVTRRADVFWKAAMMCQHYGRSAEKGCPEKLKPYVDSLVFTFRLTPIVAVLFPSQIRRLGPQVAGRQQNVAYFREAMKDCGVVEFPKLKAGFLPSYHMLTTNFRAEEAGVRRDTFLEALRAEGIYGFSYVPSPITTWRRLEWRGYDGPVPLWMANLKAAKTNYSQAKLPNCEFKIAHALDLGWNYYRPDRKAMKRLAEGFLKVQDNLPALREYEARKDRTVVKTENAVVRAARRAAAAYRKKR